MKPNDNIPLSEFIDYMPSRALLDTISLSWHLVDQGQADGEYEDPAPTVIRLCFNALIREGGKDKAWMLVKNYINPDKATFFDMVVY